MSRIVSIVAVVLLALGILAPAAAAEAIAGSTFGNVWARTDLPVADGAISRTWMWGPAADSPALQEPYAEAPGGQRLVQYFDKTRMEITNPNGDPSSIWYVTNGLLAEELITGKMQLGDNTFHQYAPAQVNVAGDANDPNGPTYATFNGLMGYAPIPNGWKITQTVNRAGQVGDDSSLASYNASAQDVGAPTHHNVASVFWAFMTSSGTVYANGQYTQAGLFQNAFYATGYPLTEAYWTNVLVGGVSRQVLVQVFERRVLTYTPSNPAGWQVEAGNVGQHYYTWRYQQLGLTATPDPNAPAAWTPPPAPAPTPPPPPTVNVQVSASVNNAAPSQYSYVTVSGTFLNNGQPVSGVEMDTAWHYKTTTSYCSGTTDGSGVASCSRDISRATIGYTVQIDVTFTWQGQTYTTSTSFTPQ